MFRPILLALFTFTLMFSAYADSSSGIDDGEEDFAVALTTLVTDDPSLP